MKSKIKMFNLYNHYYKILGVIITMISLILVMIQNLLHIVYIQKWLIQWIVVVGLTLLNFSKEKKENEIVGIIRTQSIYTGVLTSLSLIISYVLVVNVFNQNNLLRPLIIAYIINIVIFGSYYTLLYLYKRDNNLFTIEMKSAKIKLSLFNCILWLFVTTLCLSSVFIFFD